MEGSLKKLELLLANYSKLNMEKLSIYDNCDKSKLPDRLLINPNELNLKKSKTKKDTKKYEENDRRLIGRFTGGSQEAKEAQKVKSEINIIDINAAIEDNDYDDSNDSSTSHKSDEEDMRVIMETRRKLANIKPLRNNTFNKKKKVSSITQAPRKNYMYAAKEFEKYKDANVFYDDYDQVYKKKHSIGGELPNYSLYEIDRDEYHLHDPELQYTAMPQKPHKCLICGETFDVKFLLEAHKIKHSGKLLALTYKKANARKMAHIQPVATYECRFCYKRFDLMRTLHVHQLENCTKIPLHEKGKLKNMRKQQTLCGNTPRPLYAADSDKDDNLQRSMSMNSFAQFSNIQPTRLTGGATPVEWEPEPTPKPLTMREELAEMSNMFDISNLALESTCQPNKQRFDRSKLYTGPVKRSIPCFFCDCTFKHMTQYNEHTLVHHCGQHMTAARNACAKEKARQNLEERERLRKLTQKEIFKCTNLLQAPARPARPTLKAYPSVFTEREKLRERQKQLEREAHKEVERQRQRDIEREERIYKMKFAEQERERKLVKQKEIEKLKQKHKALQDANNDYTWGLNLDENKSTPAKKNTLSKNPRIIRKAK